MNLPWLVLLLRPPCLAAEEEDKSEAAEPAWLRVVGWNVGKKGQFSYWCPWASEEEQTQPDAYVDLSKPTNLPTFNLQSTFKVT